MRKDDRSPLLKANNLVVTGLMLLEDGSTEKALGCFEEALAHTAELWSFRAMALQALERHEEALACLETAHSLDRGDPEILIGMGQELMALSRYGECASACDDALELEPESAQAWFLKAGALCQMERDAEAYECLERSKELDPVNTSIHLETDWSFDRLRKTKRFEAFVGELRGCGTGSGSPWDELAYIR